MTAVSDIMILDPSSTPYVYPPDPRYTRIAVDLNQGAGGSYVYLCYTRDTDAGDPINDLTVIAGDNEDPPLPDGWKLVPGDLNAGAGGAYVYFIYR